MHVHLQLAKLDGFRTLSAVAKAANEPSLTSQVIHLHRLFMEYLQSAKLAQLVSHENLNTKSDHGMNNRSRTYSTSSAGSAGAHTNNSGLRGAGTSSTSAAAARLYTLSASAVASSNNVGTASGANLSHTYSHPSGNIYPGPFPPNNLLYSAADLDHNEDASMATKGLNIAFNFVSELLK